MEDDDEERPGGVEDDEEEGDVDAEDGDEEEDDRKEVEQELHSVGLVRAVAAALRRIAHSTSVRPPARQNALSRART